MTKLEQTILKNLIYNEAFTRKVIPFIRSDYFSEDAERIIFKEVFEFLYIIFTVMEEMIIPSPW